MTDQTTLDAVRRRLTVAVPPARAFDVFARETATWWPRDSHHLGATPADTVLEPFAGAAYVADAVQTVAAVEEDLAPLRAKLAAAEQEAQARQVRVQAILTSNPRDDVDGPRGDRDHLE